ncbi:helix-turn-helix domain-containing protein [Mangrovimonas futianensis]|uniref:helix-turn-helix domain-containing protein n=1 Tax=Mangrovimonas futianensis TaxID=2895523 RepID=UPI001E2C92D1|nr:helix-turn-helix transcriptional regulator [Mangrovimonas futianensis]MCF1420435.1 helix-turn-helix transcriptional regulator [Mangrovimonas futianensis]
MRSKIAKRILSETPEETKIFVNLYADIVVRINQIMKQKGLTQKELAYNLDKKPSEINKWLKGEHNLTLKSIAKLQAELDCPLVVVPKGDSYYNFDGHGVKKGFSLVYHNKSGVSKLQFKDASVKKMKPKYQPLANVG